MDSRSSSSSDAANLPLHVVGREKMKAINDDEADGCEDCDGTCSITSADEEAEMCFFGDAALSKEELPCDDDDEDDDDDDDYSYHRRSSRHNKLSEFAQNRVSTFERNMKTLSQALDDIDNKSSSSHHRRFNKQRATDHHHHHHHHDDNSSYYSTSASKKRGSSGSMCTLKTFNSMMSDDSDGDNISAIALIEREREILESSPEHPNNHAACTNEDDEEDNTISSPSKQQIIEFVSVRVETFTKNVDFAQEQAENLTKNIAEKMVVTTTDNDDDDVDGVQERRSNSNIFSDFVQERRNTFERNMTTIIRYHNF